MEFIIENNMIGITLSGITGLLFLFYFIIESVFFHHTKTIMIQNFIAYIFFKKRFSKILPPWWSIQSVKIYSNGFLNYKVWVSIKLETKSNHTTAGWIEMNKFFQINFSNFESLSYNMEFYDRELSDEKKKSYNREKILNDLGV